MLREQFEEDAEWGYRKSGELGGALVRVRLLQYPAGRGQKVQVEWLDGEFEGLRQWVPSGHLRCPWTEAKDYLGLEMQERGVREWAEHNLGWPEKAESEAVDLVFEALGETDLWLRENHGTFEVSEATLQRLCQRCGMGEAEVTAWPGYRRVDETWGRRWVVPWGRAMQLAEALAKAEPENVTRWVDHEEQTLIRDGYEDYRRWDHEWLRRQLPAHALVRQWAGDRDDRTRHLEAEVRRLRDLVERAARRLRDCGEERQAERLLRELR